MNIMEHFLALFHLSPFLLLLLVLQSSLRRVKSPSSSTGTGLISALSQPNLAANNNNNNAMAQQQQHLKNGLPEMGQNQTASAMQPVRSSKAHFAALHGMNLPFSGSATVQVGASRESRDKH